MKSESSAIDSPSCEAENRGYFCAVCLNLLAVAGVGRYAGHVDLVANVETCGAGRDVAMPITHLCRSATSREYHERQQQNPSHLDNDASRAQTHRTCHDSERRKSTGVNRGTPGLMEALSIQGSLGLGCVTRRLQAGGRQCVAVIALASPMVPGTGTVPLNIRAA